MNKYGNGEDKKEQHANDKIVQISSWHDDASKRKLLSIERFDNVVQIGIKKYAEDTGGYDFKYSVSVPIKWDARSVVLKMFRNMYKAAKKCDDLDYKDSVKGQKIYESDITPITNTAKLIATVKVDGNDIIAGFTFETEKGSDFFVLPTYLVNESITIDLIEAEPVNPTASALESIIETLQSYFYDFVARNNFITKKYSDNKKGGSGGNVAKNMNASDEFPF